MPSIPEPEVNVDALMAQVRAEVARRHGRSEPSDGEPGTLFPDLHEVQQLLDQAQWAATIGTAVPPFANFGPLRRRLARFVTRILYYFLQVITVDQRRFNGFVLDGIRLVEAGLRRGDAALSARLGRLEEVLAKHAAAIARQESHTETRIDHVSPRSLHTVDEGALDAFYVRFADRFRGERNEIRNRLRFHLRFIQDAGAGSRERPIVDLGCGRGEWLEVLREAGLRGYGVESNPLFVDQCRGLGFDVKAADVIAHLRSLPDDSIGAVTAFHLIEHLAFPLAVQLLDEAKRVLKAGAVIVVETPNPENVIVGSCNFYADPSHNRPLFPPTLQFLVAYCGFHDVQLFRLNSAAAEPPPFLPADDALAPSVNPLVDFARRHLFVPPCSAVVGRKPL